MYSIEPFKVVSIVIAVALLGETLCYLFVFRRAAFRNIKADSLTQQAKIDALKAKGPGNDKQIKKLEEGMLKVQANLFIFRFQTMIIQLGLLWSTWRILSNNYKGQTVAKLPFEPWKFFAKLTHATLPGDDFTDCSYNAMYILTSMVARGLVAKCINKESHAALVPKTNTFFEKLANGQKLD